MIWKQKLLFIILFTALASAPSRAQELEEGARENVSKAMESDPNPLSELTPSESLALEGLDARFVDCLRAQVDHLAAGLAGGETQPGDAVNYPLTRLSDGACVIVALARAGQIEIARELCGPFIQQDFFGGFGSEADAPGLALWAIGETASILNDPDFEAAAWPHVERKSHLIEQMLYASGNLRKPYVGPIVPEHLNKPDLDLVAGRAEEGLIQGRVDWRRPVLYVNAVSYLGLRSAVRLAQSMGRWDRAGRWSREAQALDRAWNRAFSEGKHGNERNFIRGLYPSWIVDDRPLYESRLSRLRREERNADGDFLETPRRPYFNLAQAHQWLILGRSDHCWADLRWFWEHQASEGLYTWREDAGEETASHQTEGVRGGVDPLHGAPHYWTAAEMLLLQMAMLVYVDDSRPTPEVVIGAGVPESWLSEPLKVEGAQTRLGPVHWSWDEGNLSVKMNPTDVPLRLGPAFPETTVVRRSELP